MGRLAKIKIGSSQILFHSTASLIHTAVRENGAKTKNDQNPQKHLINVFFDMKIGKTDASDVSKNISVHVCFFVCFVFTVQCSPTANNSLFSSQ